MKRIFVVLGILTLSAGFALSADRTTTNATVAKTEAKVAVATPTTTAPTTATATTAPQASCGGEAIAETVLTPGGDPELWAASAGGEILRGAPPAAPILVPTFGPAPRNALAARRVTGQLQARRPTPA